MPLIRDPAKFYLDSGSVQPYVVRDNPWFMHHFGRAQYDRNKPVVSDSIREQALPILDDLNSGRLKLNEAVEKLDKIWY